MFVIVASSAKSDIESKECVCLAKVDKIETYFDKTRVTFASLDAKNDAEYELEGADINYEFVISTNTNNRNNALKDVYTNKIKIMYNISNSCCICERKRSQ